MRNTDTDRKIRIWIYGTRIRILIRIWIYGVRELGDEVPAATLEHTWKLNKNIELGAQPAQKYNLVCGQSRTYNVRPQRRYKRRQMLKIRAVHMMNHDMVKPDSGVRHHVVIHHVPRYICLRVYFLLLALYCMLCFSPYCILDRLFYQTPCTPNIGTSKF